MKLDTERYNCLVSELWSMKFRMIKVINSVVMKKCKDMEHCFSNDEGNVFCIACTLVVGNCECLCIMMRAFFIVYVAKFASVNDPNRDVYNLDLKSMLNCLIRRV